MESFKFKKKVEKIDWELIECNLDNLTQDLLDYEAEKHEAEMEFWKGYQAEGDLEDEQ